MPWRSNLTLLDKLVGRQVHLEVGQSNFHLDLLFYHLHLRCYVVIELKTGSFDPGHVGQLNLYLKPAVDTRLRARGAW